MHQEGFSIGMFAFAAKVTESICLLSETRSASMSQSFGLHRRKLVGVGILRATHRFRNVIEAIERRVWLFRLSRTSTGESTQTPVESSTLRHRTGIAVKGAAARETAILGSERE